MISLGRVTKSIFLNQFRQDFLGIHEKIKQQLGISLPPNVSWAIALFFQSTFAVLLCAFILETVPTGQLWWILTVFILLFNLYLPSTMARQNALRVSESPLQYSLWQSAYPQGKLLFVWLLAELALFWLHELSFQLVSFYVLMRIAPSWGIALMLILFYTVVVSNIYIGMLYREVCKRWQTYASVSRKQEILYLIQCLAITFILCLMAHELLVPMTLHPLSSNLIHIDTFPLAFKELSFQFGEVLRPKLETLTQYYTDFVWIIYAGTILLLLCLLLRLFTFWLSPIHVHLHQTGLKLKEGSSNVFRLYRWIAEKLYPRNPWIVRDLYLLERVQPHLRLPLKLHLFLPPAICSLSAFFFLSLCGMTTQGIVIGYWLVSCVTLFQTTWFWLWSYPILHPESELRNVDLVHLSPVYSLGQLMQSKVKLVSVLLLPFQLLSSLFFLISITLVAGSWVEGLAGLLGIWSIFMMVCILSIWWTTYCTQFKSEGLLLIRLDTYESKLVQQLYHYPRRSMIAGLLLLFLICFFFDHQRDAVLMYSTLPVLLSLTVACFSFYRHIGTRYSLKKEGFHA